MFTRRWAGILSASWCGSSRVCRGRPRAGRQVLAGAPAAAQRRDCLVADRCAANRAAPGATRGRRTGSGRRVRRELGHHVGGHFGRRGGGKQGAFEGGLTSPPSSLSRGGSGSYSRVGPRGVGAGRLVDLEICIIAAAMEQGRPGTSGRWMWMSLTRMTTPCPSCAVAGPFGRCLGQAWPAGAFTASFCPSTGVLRVTDRGRRRGDGRNPVPRRLQRQGHARTRLDAALPKLAPGLPCRLPGPQPLHDLSASAPRTGPGAGSLRSPGGRCCLPGRPQIARARPRTCPVQGA
jgi:hypothetical protein